MVSLTRTQQPGQEKIHSQAVNGWFGLNLIVYRFRGDSVENVEAKSINGPWWSPFQTNNSRGTFTISEPKHSISLSIDLTKWGRRTNPFTVRSGWLGPSLIVFRFRGDSVENVEEKIHSQAVNGWLRLSLIVYRFLGDSLKNDEEKIHIGRKWSKSLQP